MWTISRIDHVVPWVRDLEKSLAFYQALGCQVDQGTLERYRQGRLPFVKVMTGPNSGIDLRPDPNWQPVEREKGNMQHVNLAVEGVDDIQVLIAELAKHGLKRDVGPEVQGAGGGSTSTTRTTTGLSCGSPSLQTYGPRRWRCGSTSKGWEERRRAAMARGTMRDAIDGLVDINHGLISREIFVSEDIYQQEQVFARAWLFVGHESQVPRPGDYFVSCMGEESVILTRDHQHKIHVFLNTCRHRGMKVCRYDEGNTAVFTCPYHGWSYATEGRDDGVGRHGELELRLGRQQRDHRPALPLQLSDGAGAREPS